MDWQIRIESEGGGQGAFIESGMLRNISSSGALLSLPTALPTGTQLDVYIKLPLKGESWMKYPARVVRIDLVPTGIVAAISFDAVRPDFSTQLIPT